MKRKFLLILYFNLLFCFNVFADETITIDIGNDRNVTSGDTVNIVADIGGNCSNLSLSTVYFMQQNEKGDWVTMQSGGITDNSYSYVANETKQIKAKVDCPQGVGPLFVSQITAEDIITVNVGIKSSGKSRVTKMREEAERIFYSSGTIEKINLEIGYRQEQYSPFIFIYWNNIGADGQITYDLEYSTGSTFEEYQTFKTTEEFYNFFKNDFSYGNYIHYFRVKASYLGKYSNYSNVLKYYSEDYLNINCLNKKNVNFEDVFLSYDLLIDSKLKINCTKCNVNYNNNYQNNDELNSIINNYYNIQCKKCK